MNSKKRRAQRALQDLEQNHNHSVWCEIYQRNMHNQGTALFYRGNCISYQKLLSKVDLYSKALKKLGFHKGSEIPICMSMIPEFIYLFMAISKIGAKANLFGAWFEPEYLNNILNQTKSDYLFISDDNVKVIKDLIPQSNITHIIVFSLKDSLLHGEKSHFEDGGTYKTPNCLLPFLDSRKYRVINAKQFENVTNCLSDIAKNMSLYTTEENISLEDDFTVTYTSGTTNPEKPKAVLHSIRSYMTLARFKDADVSGMGKMNGMTVLAHFPTYVHAGLTTSVVDPLFEGCTIALEPIYDKEFFLESLLINKPNFVCASVGFWCHLCKKLMFDDTYKNVILPFLYLPTVTGEGMSIGEERFFNHVSKQHRFGSDKFPFSIIPTVFSIGGGTSECSGVLVTLFKRYQRMNPLRWLYRDSIGLIPLGCCRVKVLRNDSTTPCNANEIGSVFIAGPCTMKGYYYLPDLT